MDTYEKKYKKALLRARVARQNTESAVTIGILEEIFPELKESEDERISCEITEFLVNFNNGEYERPNENTIDSWLSWLEKRGEQKNLYGIEKW